LAGNAAPVIGTSADKVGNYDILFYQGWQIPAKGGLIQ